MTTLSSPSVLHFNMTDIEDRIELCEYRVDHLRYKASSVSATGNATELESAIRELKEAWDDRTRAQRDELEVFVEWLRCFVEVKKP